MKNTNLKSCFIVCAIAGIAITNTAQAQWSLTGNAGTTPGTHFVGTTDNKALQFKTNNSTRLTISSAGKVGVGITAPTAKFEVKGAGATSDVVRFYNDKDATLDSSMIIRSNGYVGIGMSPAYKLDVAGDLRINNPGYGLLHTDGTTTIGTYVDADAGWFGTLTNHPIWFFTNNNSYPDMVVSTSGKVGIGTQTPAAKLDVNGNVSIGVSTPATGYLLTVGGKIICTELKVQAMPFPDYVFDNGYNLKSINEVEEHIAAYKRLPGMPSACEVETNGMSVGEMQTKTVEKVEEMMLYIIQLKKQNEDLQNRIELLEKK